MGFIVREVFNGKEKSKTFGTFSQAVRSFKEILKKNNLKMSQVTKLPENELKIGSLSLGFLLKLENSNKVLCGDCAAYYQCKLERKNSAILCRNFWEHLEF